MLKSDMLTSKHMSVIWKVRRMVVFLSNRFTKPFMFGIILNIDLSSMSGHQCHGNVVMQTQNILP